MWSIWIGPILKNPTWSKFFWKCQRMSLFKMTKMCFMMEKCIHLEHLYWRNQINFGAFTIFCKIFLPDCKQTADVEDYDVPRKNSEHYEEIWTATNAVGCSVFFFSFSIFFFCSIIFLLHYLLSKMYSLSIYCQNISLF